MINKDMSRYSKTERELIQRYIEGDVTIEERQKIESDIVGKADLNEYIKRSEAVWNLLDSVDNIEPNPNYISNFWNKVREEHNNEASGILQKLKNFNTKWVFITSFATILLVSSLLINIFVMQHENINNNLSFNTEDEIIFNNLDKSLTKKTAAYLDVFGPWEE